MKEEFLNNKLNNMTLSEKIGQMIMIDYRNTLEMNTELENILNKYNVGGFILFKGNTANYEQTQKLLHSVKSVGDIPVITSVDQEGGMVQRLDKRVGFKEYPPMAEIGKTLDEGLAFEVGSSIGRELKDIGIDMDMAPVLDIHTNPNNRAIASRAFGKDSELVKKMASAYADGLASEGIMAVGKHFPGHGDTIVDSHIDLPVVEKDLNELNNLELIPFKEAIKRNIPGLMVGHLAVPKVSGNMEPASLSKEIVSDLLRNSLNYDGLILTDSLKMKALTNFFTDEDIYLKTIGAGNDIILMPNDVNLAYNTVYRAVNEGSISLDRINKSVYRILNIKFDLGFFDKEFQDFTKNNDREVHRNRR